MEATVSGGTVPQGCEGGAYVDWANSRVTPDQADRILAALGLLHMRVKCVIFVIEGDYDTEVSGACDW